MKKKIIVIAALTAIAATLALTTCTSGPSSGASAKGAADSEIVVTLVECNFYRFIFVKNQAGEIVFPRNGKTYEIKGGEGTVTIPLPNGKYTVNYTYKRNDVSYPDEAASVELNYNRARVNMDHSKGGVWGLETTVTMEFMSGAIAMDASVEKAFTEIDAALPANLPPNATIAIFPVTAASADYAEIVLEGLTIHFVNAGYTVVEKRRVEELLAEYDFQMSGLVDQPTIGELLGADAVIFSTLSDQGQLDSWAVDTAKRTTLAKSVTERDVKIVEYPPAPSGGREERAAWVKAVVEIAKANPTAPYPVLPNNEAAFVYRGEFEVLEKSEGKRYPLVILPITGGSNNEAETIVSFLENNRHILNNYTVINRSNESALAKYSNLASLTREQRNEIRKTGTVIFSGTVQQVGRKNMLILYARTYTPEAREVGRLWSQAISYTDSLDLWVKLQFAVPRIIALEAKAQEYFMFQARGQSSGYGSMASESIENITLANTGDPAPVPANFTKISRIITQGGVPSGGFHICTSPVTQREYENIMKQNPSTEKNPNQPVNNVSIIDAMEFCNQMSLRHNLEPAYIIRETETELDTFATGYRLATSDEWSYANNQIEGMGVLPEYVYDGAFTRNSRMDPYVAKYMRLDNKGTVENYTIRLNEGNTGHYAGTMYPVIRLVRPIFDYWKYTSGQ